MDEPAIAVAKLKLHQQRSGLVPPVRAVEAVARLHPDTPTRAAFVARQGMDCMVWEYMEPEATLLGSAA